MRSNMKPTIFNETVTKALQLWHQTAWKQIKKNHHLGSVTPIPSVPSTPQHGLSPPNLLTYYMSEADSAPTFPRVSSYGSEPKPAEQDEGSKSHQRTHNKEEEVAQHLDHVTSQLNQFHHEIRVTDFSFEKNVD